MEVDGVEPSLVNMDLSILDQTVLRVYVRQVLIFPFPDLDFEKDAIAALRMGLLNCLQQYPFLAGKLEQTNPSSGALTVRYPHKIDDSAISQVFSIKHLSSLDLDYNTLCKEGIPTSKLPSDVLCPLTLKSHPGLDDPFAEGRTTLAKGPIPVFAAQANFFPGGLALSVYSHHSVVDGTGIAKLYQSWSSHTRDSERTGRLSTQTLPLLGGHLNPSHARHALDTLIVDAPFMDTPEFRDPNNHAPIPPLRDAPYKLRAKLLQFPADRITDLAASLSSVTNERISMFTALSALIWCQVTNARRAVLLDKGIEKTTMGLAVDHRKRVGPLIPNDYIGNCASGLIVSLPLSSLPSTETMNHEYIAPVALAISDELKTVNLDWFRARLRHMSKQPSPSKLMLNTDTVNGPDIFITSWQHIGADDVWAIPGTMKDENGSWDCKPTAIRKPQSALEGGMQILPRQREGDKPYEILLALEDAEMESLIRNLQGGAWIERVVDG